MKQYCHLWYLSLFFPLDWPPFFPGCPLVSPDWLPFPKTSHLLPQTDHFSPNWPPFLLTCPFSPNWPPFLLTCPFSPNWWLFPWQITFSWLVTFLWIPLTDHFSHNWSLSSNWPPFPLTDHFSPNLPHFPLTGHFPPVGHVLSWLATLFSLFCLYCCYPDRIPVFPDWPVFSPNWPHFISGYKCLWDLKYMTTEDGGYRLDHAHL